MKLTASKELAGNEKSLCLFIVDDNVDGAHLLGYLLEIFGHDTQVLNDPKTALAIAAQANADVFILDIEMPDMDGYELGSKLKPDFPNAIFIGHSGTSRNHQREKDIGFSFDYFVQKPTGIRELTKLLESIAQSKLI
jgi:CheY-like chemotaxis protein